MVINFTKQEQKYINYDTKGWKVKEQCPVNIRKKIEAKLQALQKAQKDSAKKAGKSDGK